MEEEGVEWVGGEEVRGEVEVTSFENRCGVGLEPVKNLFKNLKRSSVKRYLQAYIEGLTWRL